MNKNGFEMTFPVYYRDLKNNMCIKEYKLIDYLQETAVFHSEYAGFDINRFISENKGWMVTDWHIKINKALSWNDTLRIHTYPIIFRGVQAKRGFYAYNSKDEQILAASSRWAVTDLTRRRPVRIWQEMETAYGSFEPAPFETDFSHPSYDTFEKINENKIVVTRRDTDTNSHVNNVCYFEWAADNIPSDIYDSLNACEIRISYKKECTLGSLLYLKTYRKNNETITLIYNSDNILINRIYICWK